jgi:ABC-type uncharacterized transport system ATPase subunit
VPEDRQREGLIMDFDAWENVAFGYHRDPKPTRPGRCSWTTPPSRPTRKQDGALRRAPARTRACPRAISRAATSRRSCCPRDRPRPDLLLVGQPTRGVDIGAIEFIHKQIIALRDQGKAILLVSVELDEIMGLSDRIAVMFDGRIMGERLPGRPTRTMAGIDWAC